MSTRSSTRPLFIAAFILCPPFRLRACSEFLQDITFHRRHCQDCERQTFSFNYPSGPALQSPADHEPAEKALSSLGISPGSPYWLCGVTTLLSNLVSNVPAVMPLLPMVRDIPGAGYILAVSSTYAGNLLIAGSIANIIAAGKAGRMGVPFNWKARAMVGVPVTFASLAAGLAWMAMF